MNPKPFRLSPKDISRQTFGFTVVIRPDREKGGKNIYVIRVSSGLPELTLHAQSRWDVPTQVVEAQDWIASQCVSARLR